MPATERKQTPFDYWISFWPTAPLFGVRWRFEHMMPGAPFFQPVDIVAQMTAASVREVARATHEQIAAPVSRVKVAREPQPEAQAAQVAPAGVAETAAAKTPAPETPTADASPVETGALRPALLFDTAPVEADDLKQIKGVGPKLESMLNAMGIYRFDQIAAMTDSNLQWIDDNLTAFKGRPVRDDWVAQARALL